MHFTSIPVGRCLRCTQVEVLFTFCPPLPEERTNFSSMSFSWIPRDSILSLSHRFFSSLTGKVTTTYPDEDKMNPLPGLKPGVSGPWHSCHDLRPCQTCRKKPPLRFERMPFIPRLKSLGFSGIAYKFQ